MKNKEQDRQMPEKLKQCNIRMKDGEEELRESFGFKIARTSRAGTEKGMAPLSIQLPANYYALQILLRYYPHVYPMRAVITHPRRSHCRYRRQIMKVFIRHG